MEKSNVLGTYIRNKRKDKGFFDVTSFARRLSRSVSYVSRVELGNSDGPSLKFLSEIAQVLEVDLKYLLELKEQDNLAGLQPLPRDAARAEAIGGIRLDEVVRRVLSPPARTDRGRAAPPDTESLALQDSLQAIGGARLGIAEAFLAAGRGEECVEQLLMALDAYEQLGDGGGAAFSCFNIGRAHRRMAHDPVFPTDERLRHIMEANDWLGRAYGLFMDNYEQLSDERRGRVPECLSQWARSDEQIAMHIVQPEDTLCDGFDDVGRTKAYNDMREAAQKYYREGARAKREVALAQYGTWIERLKVQATATEGSIERNVISGMLASAYHRLGVLRRDLAWAEGASPEHRRLDLRPFLETLELRRALATAFPDSVEQTERQLDRLANAHSDVGLSILLDMGREGKINVPAREEAYWQFRVAQKVYSMLGLSSSDMRVEYVDSHLIGIQREQALESEIVSRQNLERFLERADFGTRERPAFGYPILYRLGGELAGEQ